MNGVDHSRTITSAVPIGFTRVRLGWSDDTIVDLDLGAILNDHAFSALSDQAEFAQVRIGDWGHSLIWPSGAEMGADRGLGATVEAGGMVMGGAWTSSTSSGNVRPHLRQHVD